MKYFLLITLLSGFATKVLCQHPEINHADSVLEWLINGNNDFVQGKFDIHGIDSSLRMAVSKAQHPKAVILACSDSRVSPELIFDKGLGDLFVIRVAGNIVDDAVIGSVEYAVEHLHTSLVVLLIPHPVVKNNFRGE